MVPLLRAFSRLALFRFRTRILASVLYAGCVLSARAQRQTVDRDQGWDGPTPGQAPRPEENGADYWRGAFTAFAFELTSRLRYGARNDLRVRADNGFNRQVAPLSGDFNVDGGIYRPVRLIVTNDVCISPLDHGTDGVYLSVLQASPEAVELRAIIKLANSEFSDQSIQITTVVRRADGSPAVAAVGDAVVAGDAPAQSATLLLAWRNPHWWNGRSDPDLYRITVQALRRGRVIDQVDTHFGVRTVTLGRGGFRLNGHPYPIHGVCRHQDLKYHGWALEPAAALQSPFDRILGIIQ
ncbi:MAG TPA: hypothetical protein VGL42_05285 [Opitutaceae bacterium]|jgi:beta-galactosidase